MLTVTGIGMLTPLGYNTPQTCAAVRAGIAAFAEISGTVGRTGSPVVAARLPPSSEGDSSEEAFLRFYFAACREALAGFDPAELRARRVTWSILTKENGRPGGPEIDTGGLARLFASREWPPGWQAIFYRYGNAAGMKALSDAQLRLADDPASLEVIWGVDRLTDFATLRYLEACDRLKGPHQPRGLIPGEASACIALEAPQSAARGRRQPWCHIVAVGTSDEPAGVLSDGLCLGQGLTKAIREALDSAKWSIEGRLPIWCDLNGEVYRAHEWMLALCRTLEDVEVMHPADCLGDVAAASTPLLVGLAGVALRHAYAGGDRTLVFCSSDLGSRGAACLETVRA